MNTLFPVILCGGSGTRLWPLSRTDMPKQFIAINGTSTPFEDTLKRVKALSDQSIIVCNDRHRFLVRSTMAKQGFHFEKNAIFLEPHAKNTALPIALSALQALEKNENACLLVLPSDHVLEPLETFMQKVEEVLPLLENTILTFGIQPTSPHTGYGYIKRGKTVTDSISKVSSFTEKPDTENAKALINQKALWNSGMFLMRADVYLEELKLFREDIYNDAVQIWASRCNDLDFTRFDVALFEKAHAESIDYAVMEQTNKACVCPLEITWSDLGSFQALYEEGPKDIDNNCLVGDVLTMNTKDSYVYSSNALVSVLGLDNVAVVQTKDAVMVAALDKTQELKSFITLMQDKGRVEKDFHAVCHRPWGHYESLINSDRFQVKHITVEPKGSLSVQMHHHRSEHWIVVKGTALILIGEEEKLLTENESVYIPLGAVHRLTNPGHIPLELIEVQTGSYLGEDDITRFDDVYGRH